MAKRKSSGIPGVSFSVKRAVGISSAKQKFARKTGIPTTRSGMQRKVGRAAGCLVPLLFLIIILTSLILFSSVALASSVDLSNMTFDELVALKQQVNLQLWSVEEWQQVTVPQGVYEIGVDIPAGHWIIKAAEGQKASLHWGDALDQSGVNISYNGDIYVADEVFSTTYINYDTGDKLQVDYELKNGQFIVIGYGQAVFSPFTGKSDLGFK